MANPNPCKKTRFKTERKERQEVNVVALANNGQNGGKIALSTFD